MVPGMISSTVRFSMHKIFRPILLIPLAVTVAFAQTTPAAPTGGKPAQSSPHKLDRGAAYYHYAVAHMYAEQVTGSGRSELANKAIEEYRLAIQADPSSEFLTSGLAEL